MNVDCHCLRKLQEQSIIDNP